MPSIQYNPTSSNTLKQGQRTEAGERRDAANTGKAKQTNAEAPSLSHSKHQNIKTHKPSAEFCDICGISTTSLSHQGKEMQLS